MRHSHRPTKIGSIRRPTSAFERAAKIFRAASVRFTNFFLRQVHTVVPFLTELCPESPEGKK